MENHFYYVSFIIDIYYHISIFKYQREREREIPLKIENLRLLYKIYNNKKKKKNILDIYYNYI